MRKEEENINFEEQRERERDWRVDREIDIPIIDRLNFPAPQCATK